MKITVVDNDVEVRNLMIGCRVYSRFMAGRKMMSDDPTSPKMWATGHYEPGRSYLFMGFADFESPEDNGYQCTYVDFEPGEEEAVADFLNHLIHSSAGDNLKWGRL